MDVIDERNRREKMAKSIIKRRNVVYSCATPEKIGESEENAEEILAHLAELHQKEEDRKRGEIEKLLEQQKQNQMEIERILDEKQSNLEKTMDEAGRDT